jgi:preprotein translocase subunit SecE
VGSSPTFRAIFKFPISQGKSGMFAKVSRFVGEVKGELRKANWPWESDPKIKGFKKYKELVDSTVVVLIATILLAGFVSLWDFICIYVINFITSFGH